eukprot:scaffold43012_cov49-Phaeocystis_antarctica.AAC.1
MAPSPSSRPQLLALRRSRVPASTRSTLSGIRPQHPPHIALKPPGKGIIPELPHPRPHRRCRCLRRPHAVLGARAACSR